MAKYLGVSLGEVMAVGDGKNDISLLSVAGLGIAMGNASDELKGIADHVTLDVDEHFHFWRVADIQRPHRLVLESRMKAPGEALMVLQLTPQSGTTELVLQSLFLSRGLSGIGYWYGLYPAHRRVFRDMLNGIARACGSAVLIGPERIDVPS